MCDICNLLKYMYMYADHIEWYNGQFTLLYKNLTQTRPVLHVHVHVCTWQLNFHGCLMHNLRDLTCLPNVCILLYWQYVSCRCVHLHVCLRCVYVELCVHVLSLVHNIFACVALQPDVHAFKCMLQCKNSVFLCCIATRVQIILHALPSHNTT